MGTVNGRVCNQRVIREGGREGEAWGEGEREGKVTTG